MDDLLIQIQNKLNEIEMKQDKLEKAVARMKIDRQMVIERNDRMKPGIATKVMYDYNGLITGTSKLTSTDIPALPISKIEGLNEALENKATIGDINKLRARISASEGHSTIANTGCKVNIDDKGHVISIAKLTQADIPKIPITKIDGLDELLKQIRTPAVKEEVPTINPGKGCKISYDKFGKVVNSSELTINDIPNELIKRINKLEETVNGLASKKQVSEIQSSLVNKMEKPRSIGPGVFTKVVVDSNGLVMKGDLLEKTDIPTVNMRDIPGLNHSIDMKADRADLISINESISVLNDSMNHIKDRLKKIETRLLGLIT